jgi:hypothetical protein
LQDFRPFGAVLARAAANSRKHSNALEMNTLFRPEQGISICGTGN